MIPNIDGYSIKISQSYYTPNFEISKDVDLSDVYRKSIDSWCIEFFGSVCYDMFKDGDIVVTGNIITMNKNTYDIFKYYIS